MLIRLLVVEVLHQTNTENKSNSTADAVQVETNLQEQLSDHFYVRQERAA